MRIHYALVTGLASALMITAGVQLFLAFKEIALYKLSGHLRSYFPQSLDKAK